VTEGPPSILDAIHDLFEAREYQEVVDRLGEVRRGIQMRDPELLLIHAASLQYLFLVGESARLLKEAEEPIRRSKNGSYVRRWQNLMANSLIELGRLDDARDLLSDCLTSAEEANHIRVVGYASNGLGIIASLRGNVEEAVGLYTRSLTIWQQLGDALGVGIAHHNLGLILREWGRLNEATAHFVLAEEYFADHGTAVERIYPTAERALLHMDLGDEEMAERLAATAVERAEGLSNPYIRSAAAKVFGAILLRCRGPEAARPWLREALAAADRAGNRLLRAEVHEELAILELRSGDPKRAEDHRTLSAELYASLGAEKHVKRFDSRFRSSVLSI
jgi:tetratricopeptide (TPR) repeat protein